MKIICDKRELVNGLSIVSRAVATNSTMASLENVLIEANGAITLTGNDLELGIKTTVVGMAIEDGEAAVPAKDLTEVVKKLSDGEVTIETDENNTLNIRSGKTKINIFGKDGSEFQRLPEVKDGAVSVKMGAQALAGAVERVLFAAGDGSVNRVMAGVDMAVKHGEVAFTALDGHRVAMRNVKTEGGGEVEAIIPSRSMGEVAKIIAKSGEVKIDFTGSQAVFTFGETVAVVRLIEGKYIDVSRMLTDKHETKVTANRAALYECVDRAGLFSKDNKKPIVMDVAGNALTVTVNAASGNIEDSVDVLQDGKDIRIGFSPRYVADALRAVDDEQVELYFTNPKAPMYVKGDGYTYLVLPVNLG